MKVWRIDVEITPQEIMNKLDSDTLTNSGFVFNVVEHQNEPIQFILRKRIRDFDKLFYYNLIIVKGKISKTDRENTSTVVIVFKEHFLNLLIRIVLFLISLLAIIAVFLNNILALIPGFIFFTLGIILWYWMKKKFDENINNYKTFFSGLFDNRPVQGTKN